MVDVWGYIISEVDFDLIAPVFRPLLLECRSALADAIGDDLYTLYLFGSIPAGRAVVGKSDINLLALLQWSAEPEVEKRIEETRKQLAERYRKVVRDVMLLQTTMDEAFNGHRELAWKVFIKHLCLLLAGDDVSAELPAYRPTPEVAAALDGDAPDVLERLWRELKSTHAEDVRSRLGGQIARKILYTAMSAITAETGIWVTSRTALATQICRHYPTRSGDVHLLLEVAEEKELALVGELRHLRKLIDWAISEARRVLHHHRQF